VIKTGPETALTKPTMAPEKLGVNLERYLLEDRQADAWIALMEQTETLGLSEEDVELMVHALEESREEGKLFTPWKRRKLLKSVAPSLSELV
jgi:hypothetical protein